MKELKLKKEINDLDNFVFEFIDILKNFTDYVIVSGYIAILFGRSRGTEDIDILINKIDKNLFKKLVKKLSEKYWFLNTDNIDKLYALLCFNSIRIALKKNLIPNIELKTIKNEIEKFSFSNKIKLIIEETNIQRKDTTKEIFIPELELQVAYKKEILKSKKDIEDAIFLEEVLKLDKKKIKEYILFIRKNEEKY